MLLTRALLTQKFLFLSVLIALHYGMAGAHHMAGAPGNGPSPSYPKYQCQAASREASPSDHTFGSRPRTNRPCVIKQHGRRRRSRLILRFA